MGGGKGEVCLSLVCRWKKMRIRLLPQ